MLNWRMSWLSLVQSSAHKCESAACSIMLLPFMAMVLNVALYPGFPKWVFPVTWKTSTRQTCLAMLTSPKWVFPVTWKTSTRQTCLAMLTSLHLTVLLASLYLCSPGKLGMCLVFDPPLPSPHHSDLLLETVAHCRIRERYGRVPDIV